MRQSTTNGQGQTCRAKEETHVAEVKTLTDATFDSEVTDAGTPMIVDFWAPWCGPCRMVGPVIDEIAEEHGDKVERGQGQRRREPGDGQQVRHHEHPHDHPVQGRRSRPRRSSARAPRPTSSASSSWPERPSAGGDAAERRAARAVRRRGRPHGRPLRTRGPAAPGPSSSALVRGLRPRAAHLMASRPRSPVRVRTASSIGSTKILPSPIWLLFSEAVMALDDALDVLLEHDHLDLHLGMEADTRPA